jgi:hypothetical protein
MTHEEYAREMEAGRIKKHPLEEIGIGMPEPAPQRRTYQLEDFLPILRELLSPKQHLESAPTFVPQTLLESIQIYDDGVDRRIYFYVNGTWRYVALT